MKRAVLLMATASAVFAGGLQIQAEALGSARAIALYWGEHVKSDSVAREKCEEYAKGQYAGQQEQEICINSCVENFKKAADKNGR